MDYFDDEFDPDSEVESGQKFTVELMIPNKWTEPVQVTINGLPLAECIREASEEEKAEAYRLLQKNRLKLIRLLTETVQQFGTEAEVNVVSAVDELIGRVLAVGH